MFFAYSIISANLSYPCPPFQVFSLWCVLSSFFVAKHSFGYRRGTWFQLFCMLMVTDVFTVTLDFVMSFLWRMASDLLQVTTSDVFFGAHNLIFFVLTCFFFVFVAKRSFSFFCRNVWSRTFLFPSIFLESVTCRASFAMSCLQRLVSEVFDE